MNSTVAEMNFDHWIKYAQPNETYLYYVGHLARDIELKQKVIPTICRTLYTLATSGNTPITLFQRRNGPDFEYYALKLRKPMETRLWSLS